MDEIDWSELLTQALAARERAYAPYSGFKVGAAITGVSGAIYQGCNVENVSYGLTICAERVAIGAAVAAGERQYTGVCVVADSIDPVTPCGACRQVLVEFMGPETPVLLSNLAGAVRRTTIGALMPDAFWTRLGPGRSPNG